MKEWQIPSNPIIRITADSHTMSFIHNIRTHGARKNRDNYVHSLVQQ